MIIVFFHREILNGREVLLVSHGVCTETDQIINMSGSTFNPQDVVFNTDYNEYVLKENNAST